MLLLLPSLMLVVTFSVEDLCVSCRSSASFIYSSLSPLLQCSVLLVSRFFSHLVTCVSYLLVTYVSRFSSQNWSLSSIYRFLKRQKIIMDDFLIGKLNHFKKLLLMQKTKYIDKLIFMIFKEKGLISTDKSLSISLSPRIVCVNQSVQISKSRNSSNYDNEPQEILTL